MVADSENEGLLLGKHTPQLQEYSPHILHAIPRKIARENLGLGEALPFHGVDQWHAYELSWLDAGGKPNVRVGRFTVPASSPNIIESKSVKLYLNSLNNSQFVSADEFCETVVSDFSNIAGEGVELELFTVDDPSLAGSVFKGKSLDKFPVEAYSGEPVAEQLQIESEQVVDEIVYSHLLRSLCPVTGQPDWASVWFHYCGAAIDHRSLLQYIIAYRDHQEFHEQCVERMFCDISRRCKPQLLQIQAFYTRRGGLDINPFRTTEPHAEPLPRRNRQ